MHGDCETGSDLARHNWSSEVAVLLPGKPQMGSALSGNLDEQHSSPGQSAKAKATPVTKPYSAVAPAGKTNKSKPERPSGAPKKDAPVPQAPNSAPAKAITAAQQADQFLDSLQSSSVLLTCLAVESHY